MIKSFADRRTAALFQGLGPRGVPTDILSVLQRKLRQIDAAASLNFLRVPPGNRLEALKGDRAGQYSIRVNDQWRLCFRWTGSDAEDVELCDYH